jgi:flagellar motor switch protein FliN/FliY
MSKGMNSMANDQWINQEALERLLSQSPGMATATQAVAAPSGDATAKPSLSEEAATSLLAGQGEVSPHDIDFLLRQAEQAVQSLLSPPADALPQGVARFQLDELPSGAVTADAANLDLIRDVELNLKIELGRTQMHLEDVLKLRKGSVVPLDKLAGDPVDIYADGRLIARGEVLVMDDSFCVRVVDLAVGANEEL